MLPRLRCRGETLNSQSEQTFQFFFDQSQDVFVNPRPWQTFFSKYLKNRRRYRKKIVLNQSKSWSFTSTRLSLFFDIVNDFRDIRVQRIAKITPPPHFKVWGNISPTVLPRGGFRFEAKCNIDTRKISFKAVNLFVRYPLTNFFCAYRQTDTRQSKNQFSWRSSVNQMFTKLNSDFLYGISLLPFVPRTWREKDGSRARNEFSNLI